MFIRVRPTPLKAPLMDVCIFDDRRRLLAFFSHLTPRMAQQQFDSLVETICRWPLIDEQPVNGGEES